MKRSYRNIQLYEKEILELKAQGFTRNQIGEKLGFTPEQIHSFTTRYNRKQRKLAAGVALKKKGRPTEGEQTVETLAKAIRPAFEGYDCGQIGAAIYQILDDLARAGKLKCERRYQKGQFEGLQAPIDYMWL